MAATLNALGLFTRQNGGGEWLARRVNATAGAAAGARRGETSKEVSA